MDLKTQQQTPLTGLQTLVWGLPMSPTGRLISSYPQLTSAYVQHSSVCLQQDMQVSKDSVHTLPQMAHTSLCRWHTHIPMGSTQILAAAQLCRIDRKNTTLNASGHCPGKINGKLLAPILTLQDWEKAKIFWDFSLKKRTKKVGQMYPRKA